MSDDMNYTPYRMSQKQMKCRAALGEVMKIQMEMRKKERSIIGVPKLKTMRGIKEIVSGLAIPMKERG